MEHKHPTPARSDAAFDSSVAPVGPLIPSDSADSEPGDNPLALPESPSYDPAEYRWVPVRRRPRADGWTEEKQRRFIEALADTGLVSHAAKAVGMSRQSATRLRRSPHGAAFARAWDAARLHSGSALEDIAFERAIEGEERNVYNEYGEVVCTKRVVNDRMLTFLLSHLLPERYGKAARGAGSAPADPLPSPSPPEMLEACLRAMEPELPAPPEEMIDPETLAMELDVADIADGFLPHFYSEQRPAKSAERLKADEIAEQEARGKIAWEKAERNEGELRKDEFRDMCLYLDPTQRADKGRRRYR
jgi:hypothetical protein